MTVSRVSAHIVVSDAAAACRFYEDAFGAREVKRVPLPDGGVMTIEIKIGESRVHLGSEFPDAGILSPLSIGGTGTVLQIDTDDADALWNRAVGAGARVHHPLADQFWGERHGQITDPFGHRWNVAQRFREVSAEELAAGAAAAFGGAPGGT